MSKEKENKDIEDAFKEFKLNTRDSEVLITSLKLLFDDNESSELSVKYERNFHKYFGNALFESDLSDAQFKEVLNLEPSEKIKRLKEYSDSGKYSDIERKILGSNLFNSEAEFASLIQMWIVLLNFSSDKLSEEFLMFLEKAKTALKLADDKFALLFRQLFDTKQSVHFDRTTVLRDILRHYIKDKSYQFPLSKKEIQDLALERLNEYSKSVVEIDEQCFNYYYSCYETIDEDNRVILMNEANEIILKKIQQNPKAYIKYIIRPLYRPHDGKTYTFEPFIPRYFESWEKFYEFIQLQTLIDENVQDIVKYYHDFAKNSFYAFTTDEKIKWLSKGQNDYVDVEPKPLNQEQLQKVVLVGTWRNDWISSDNRAGTETAQITSDLKYMFLDGRHLFDLKSVHVDISKREVHFVKMAVGPDDKRQLRNTLKIEMLNLLSGDEENFPIKYTRIDPQRSDETKNDKGQ